LYQNNKQIMNDSEAVKSCTDTSRVQDREEQAFSEKFKQTCRHSTDSPEVPKENFGWNDII